MYQLQVSNMNSIEKIFGEHAVRMFYDEYTNVWFVGSDVCKILDYKNECRTINNHVDDVDKMSYKEFINKGTDLVSLFKLHPKTILINESGFYSLVLRSKQDNADRFRRWVTYEVLPSIRKTCKYEIEKSQKAIELEHMKIQLELTNAETSKIREENKKKELELKENEQKIEMKKLTLIDNNESRYDAHYDILARERIQGNEDVPDYIELSSLLEIKDEEFHLTPKDIISLRGTIGKAIKKWFKENNNGGQSPSTYKKYVNGGTHNVCFYPIEYKDEIIREIRKLLNEKKNFYDTC